MKQQIKDHAIAFDDFLEDLLGLNVRGLKSIYTIFVDPQSYFSSAKLPDWGKTYTPSVRLWLSIVAITFFFKFLWADISSAAIRYIALQFKEFEIMLPGQITYEMAAETYAQWWFAYLPFTNLVGLFLLASIWPFWCGQPTTLALRARYIYAAVIPSSCVSIFTFVGSTWLHVDYFYFYTLCLYGLSFGLDLLTLLRGVFISAGAAVWRASALAAALLVVNIMASHGAQLGAQITISILHS